LKKEKNDNYFIVYDWMFKLGLTGSDLLIYALIHSFSKDGAADFHGSSEYIAKRLNITSRTVLNTLKRLTEKEMIEKNKKGRYRNYTTVSMKNLHTSSMKDFHTIYENSSQVSMKDFPVIYENSSHHIKSNNKAYNKSSSSNEQAAAFINLCKNNGHHITETIAKEALESGIEGSWLSGNYTYPEYIAEVVGKRCPNNPTGLFISLLSASDKKNEFPAWREEKEAEEIRTRNKAEIEAAFNNPPSNCEKCNGEFKRQHDRMICIKCEIACDFNRTVKKWIYEEDHETE